MNPVGSGLEMNEANYDEAVQVATCYTCIVISRGNRPAGGRERACNSHTSCIESEMLVVTNVTL